MGFAAGFAAELEKLALRLPSPQEMLGAAASGQTSMPTPAPEPAPPSPGQHLHIHVHSGAGGKGGGGKPKAALPKPPQDAPGPRGATVGSPTIERVPDMPQSAFLPASQRGPQLSDKIGPSPSFAGHHKTHDYSSQMKPAPSGPDTGPVIAHMSATHGANIPLGISWYTSQDKASPGTSSPGGGAPALSPAAINAWKHNMGLPEEGTAGGQKFEFQQLPSAKSRRAPHHTASLGVPGAGAKSPWKDTFTTGDYDQAPSEPVKI